MFAKFNGNSVTICGRLPKSLLHLQGHYDYLWIVFVRNNAIPKNLQAFFRFVEQSGWMNAVIEVWDSTSTISSYYLNQKWFYLAAGFKTSYVNRNQIEVDLRHPLKQKYKSSMNYHIVFKYLKLILKYVHRFNWCSILEKYLRF